MRSSQVEEGTHFFRGARRASRSLTAPRVALGLRDVPHLGLGRGPRRRSVAPYRFSQRYIVGTTYTSCSIVRSTISESFASSTPATRPPRLIGCPTLTWETTSSDAIAWT